MAYAATPRRGLYFLEPDEHVPDRPRQVWTQCQEEDARHFVPCHDKPHVKMTTEIVGPRAERLVRALERRARHQDDAEDGGLAVPLEDGRAAPELPAHARRRRVRRARATTRGAMGSREVPLTYLVPKGREEDGRRTFARTPQMIEHFGDITGVPYPWNKYAQVVVSDFIFGGMENTTATTMYEHILLDERAAIDVTTDDLIAHELAHQWFGDYVTCRDWYEGWLNEGFATFFEHVWREKHLGRDEYDYGLKGDLDGYLGEAHGRYRRPIVCQDYDAPLDLFDRHLYEKGALVLHALRVELGRRALLARRRLYLTRHARGVVETRDLQRALEEVSGRSLGRLFEQWVYKPGHPECDVVVGWEKGVLTVAVKQHQATTDGVPAVFEFPLTIEIDDAGDGAGKHGKPAVRRERLLVTQKGDTFALPCATRPAFVVVDPDMRVLGEVHLKGAGRHAARAARGRADRARTLARGAGARDERRSGLDRRARGEARRRRRDLGRARASVPRRSGGSARARRSRRSPGWPR